MICRCTIFSHKQTKKSPLRWIYLFICTLLLCLAPVNIFGNPLAYLTCNSDDIVEVVDTSLNTVIDVVPVGSDPLGIAVTPDKKFAYVANSGSNNVSVIATSTNTVIDTISTGGSPTAIAITPSGRFVYVTNTSGNSVTVIRTFDNKVITTIPVQVAPEGIAITPNNDFVYVTNKLSNSVSVIRVVDNTVIKTILGVPSPKGIAVAPDGTRVYVANAAELTVITTNTNSIFTIVPAVNGSFDVAVTPDSAFVYISSSLLPIVTVIRAADFFTVAFIDVGGTSRGIAATLDGRFVFVTVPTLSSLVRIRTFDNMIIAPLIATCDSPYDIAFPTPASPNPPLNFTAVCKKNTFLTSKEIFIRLTWCPPPNSPPPTKYKIFRKTSCSETLIATILPTCRDLVFDDHNRSKNICYEYRIVAEDNLGIIASETIKIICK